MPVACILYLRVGMLCLVRYVTSSYDKASKEWQTLPRIECNMHSSLYLQLTVTTLYTKQDYLLFYHINYLIP